MIEQVTLESPAINVSFASASLGGEAGVCSTRRQMKPVQGELVLVFAGLVHHAHGEVIDVAWISTGGA